MSLSYRAWLVIGFIVIYSFFIFRVDYTFEGYPQVLAATVFFFALFSGFFITRQNNRYTRVLQTITESDGLFSYLYRMSGLVPNVQKEVREIIRKHYQKILESGNWAYHVLNPSTTLTDLVYAFEKVNNEENKEAASKQAASDALKSVWGTIKDLQLKRKNMLVLHGERLLFFQWAIIYILALLLVVTFNFIPTPGETFIINILKILFGTTVFIVIILLKQLNDLSIFGKDFAEKTARDVFRILDEKDKEEIKE